MSALPQDEELSALLNDLDDVDGAIEIIQKPVKQPKKKVVEEEHIPVPDHQPDPEPPTSNEAKEDDLYDTSVQELLVNYRKDRQDIDKLVKYLWEKLEKSEPSRVIFESLANSLRTKSEANNNLLKLIDIISKKSKTSSIDGLDLESLLDE